MIAYRDTRIPEPPLEPPDPPPWRYCGAPGGCGEPIYRGDGYYMVDGSALCEECGRRYLDCLYRRTAPEYERGPL